MAWLVLTFLSKYQGLSAANGKVADMIFEQWSRHQADTKPLKGKGYWLTELKNLFLLTTVRFLHLSYQYVGRFWGQVEAMKTITTVTVAIQVTL